MAIKRLLPAIAKKKWMVLAIIISASALTAAAVFIQPLRYEARSRLLIVQNFQKNADPTATAKSNEYLCNVLVGVSTSDAFFQKAMQSGYHIDQSYFPDSPEGRMKKWNETVIVKAEKDSGIIDVSVFHKDKYQLDQLARAVNYALKTQTSQFHDRYDAAAIKVIDEPIISSWPVKPNIALDLSLGIAVGIISSLIYVYISTPHISIETVKTATATTGQPAEDKDRISEDDKDDNEIIYHYPEPEKQDIALPVEKETGYEDRETYITPKSTLKDIKSRGKMDNLLSA